MDRWPPYGGGREGRFDCIFFIPHEESYSNTVFANGLDNDVIVLSLKERHFFVISEGGGK